MKQITFITAVLIGGNGDFGNMLNFARVLKAKYPDLTIDAVVLCLNEQIEPLQLISKETESLLTCHYIDCPKDEARYAQEDLYHYSVPGPGLFEPSTSQKSLFDKSDAIYEYPVSYPYLKEVLGDAFQKCKRFVEYGRETHGLEPGIIHTGLSNNEEGILWLPRPDSTENLDGLTQEFLKKLLFKQKSPGLLIPGYLRTSPDDPNHQFVLHFIFLSVFMNPGLNLDIMISPEIESLSGIEPVLYEFGIEKLEIITPSKRSSLTISLSSFDKKLQKLLKKKNKPNATLRLFCGFKMSQADYHRVLSQALSQAESHDVSLVPMGVSGDGSLTDALSFSLKSEKVKFWPCFKQVLECHELTMKGLVDYSESLEKEGLGTLLQSSASLKGIDGRKLYELSQLLKDPELLASYKDFLHRLFEDKNLLKNILLS